MSLTAVAKPQAPLNLQYDTCRGVTQISGSGAPPPPPPPPPTFHSLDLRIHLVQLSGVPGVEILQLDRELLHQLSLPCLEPGLQGRRVRRCKACRPPHLVGREQEPSGGQQEDEGPHYHEQQYCVRREQPHLPVATPPRHEGSKGKS